MKVIDRVGLIFLIVGTILLVGGIVIYHTSGESVVDLQARTIKEQREVIEQHELIQNQHLIATKAIAESLTDLNKRVKKLEELKRVRNTTDAARPRPEGGKSKDE